jgi:hypothetical protein
MYLYTYLPIPLYTYTPTYLYTNVPMYLYTYVPINLCTCTFIHLCTYRADLLISHSLRWGFSRVYALIDEVVSPPAFGAHHPQGADHLSGVVVAAAAEVEAAVPVERGGGLCL